MRRTLETLATWWAIAGGVLLLVITGVTSYNVGAFVVADMARGLGVRVTGLPGYEDLVRLVISCAALMFFPYCQLRRGHVVVEIFAAALPARLRGALDRAWTALIALTAVFLGAMMMVGLIETRADHTSTSILGWVEWPFYIPGIVSLALWAAIAAMQCAGAAAEAGKGGERGAGDGA